MLAQRASLFQPDGFSLGPFADLGPKGPSRRIQCPLPRTLGHGAMQRSDFSQFPAGLLTSSQQRDGGQETASNSQEAASNKARQPYSSVLWLRATTGTVIGSARYSAAMRVMSRSYVHTIPSPLTRACLVYGVTQARLPFPRNCDRMA